MKRYGMLFIALLTWMSVAFSASWVETLGITKTVDTGEETYEIELIEDRGWIAVSCHGDDRVRFFDYDLNPVFDFSLERPRGLLYDKQNGYLYALSWPNSLSSLSGTENCLLWVIDLNARKALSTVIVGAAPVRMALTRDRKLCVVNRDGGSVSVIDVNTFTLLKTISVGTAPQDIVYDEENQQVFVTDVVEDRVIVINARDDSKVAISVGRTPSHLLLLPEGRVAISCRVADQIQIRDRETMTLIQSVPFRNPKEMALHPDNLHVFVASYSGRTLGVFTTDTYAQIGAISTKEPISQLKVTSTGDRLFFAGTGANQAGLMQIAYRGARAHASEKRLYLDNELILFDAKYYIDRGLRAFFGNDLSEAKRNFLQSLELCLPGDIDLKSDAFLYLSRVAVHENRREEARGYLEEILDIDPSNFFAVSSLIEDFYWNDPNSAKLLKDLPAKLENFAYNDYLKYAILIRMRFKESGYEQAIMDNIARIVGFSPEYLALLTPAMVSQDLEVVRSLYRKYLARITDNPTDALSNFVAGYWELTVENRVFSALRRLSTSYGLNPNNHYAYFLVGKLMLEDEPSEGILSLRKAIELAPSFPLYYRDLAQAYNEYAEQMPDPLGMYSEGIETGERGMALNPLDQLLLRTVHQLYDKKLKALRALPPTEDTYQKIIESIERYLVLSSEDRKGALTEQLKETYSKIVYLYIVAGETRKAANLAETLEKRYKGEFSAYAQLINGASRQIPLIATLTGKRVAFFKHKDTPLDAYDTFILSLVKEQCAQKGAIPAEVEGLEQALAKLQEEKLEEFMPVFAQIASENALDAIIWVSSIQLSAKETQTKIHLIRPATNEKQAQSFVVQPDYSVRGLLQP